MSRIIQYFYSTNWLQFPEGTIHVDFCQHVQEFKQALKSCNPVQGAGTRRIPFESRQLYKSAGFDSISGIHSNSKRFLKDILFLLSSEFIDLTYRWRDLVRRRDRITLIRINEGIKVLITLPDGRGRLNKWAENEFGAPLSKLV